MFDKNFLDGSTKEFNVFTEHGRRLDQIGVHVIGELVRPPETDDRSTPLRDLAEDDSKVWDGILHGLLQFAQMSSGILQACKLLEIDHGHTSCYHSTGYSDK